MRSTRVRLAVAAAAGVAASATLVAPTTQAAQGVRPPTIYVHITAGHTVRMVDAMHPGVHRFKISSAKPAGFQLVMPRSGYTKRMAVHDIKVGLATQDNSSPQALRAIRRFERNVTLLGGISSAPGHRGNIWVDLSGGHYWAVDTMPAVPRVSDFHDFSVGGRRVAGTMPNGGPVLRAIKEATWAPAPRGIPASGIATFSNQSKDNHFIATGQLAKGKTFKDFVSWIKNPSGPPPFDQNNPGLNTGALSPGHSFAFAYDLTPGRYVMLCFWPDAEHGGMPHAFMGMYRQLNVGL